MITIKDIREKEFAAEKNGYNQDEVDNFLDEIAEQTETLIRENQQLAAQLKEANDNLANVKTDMIEDEQAYIKNVEAALRETLISAQRIAEETVAKARKQAVASAEEQANAILSSAKAEAETAKAETAEIRKAIEDYRARFIRLVEEQAAVLKTDLGLFE